MATRTPYGRHSVEVLGEVPRDGSPPTYYDRPAIKPSEWRWLVITYFFVGGLSGAAQVIAGVVDLFGHERDRPLVRAARSLAVAGALISPMCLIADLKMPSRWYNMLRIVRLSSPMNLGSWTLSAFGGLSSLTLLAQLLDDVFGVRAARTAARLIGIPAALSGALLATYTGALISATSTPLWAAGYRLLPALFGASGTSTATAALSLILRSTAAPRSSVRRLERVALIAGVLELVLALRLDNTLKREQVSAPLEERPLVVPYQAGAMGLGIIAPLAVHLAQLLTGRELRLAASLASACALVGGFAQRSTLILAGKRSATRPRDYFRMSQ